MDTWLRSAIDYIGSWIEFQLTTSQQPGVIVAFAHRGEVVTEYAFGLANLDTGEKLTPRHRFRIASHSKSFTSAGIMKLREQRKLRLDDRVGDSYAIFANVRNVRFNEMEYSVPAEAGPACLREILKKIHDKQLPTWFPLEYRYVHADDIPLSMFEGGPRCAISIHQHYTMDYHNYFAAIEPIFWKYGGRPHWGKLHTLGARQLAPLYPRWKEFTDVRAALDPQGRFLNGHLRTVFGV